MLLPNENDDKIQDILKDDIPLDRKAYRIEKYYKSKILYNRVRGRIQEKPPLNHVQIVMELEKRGEELAPIDVNK